MKQILILNFNFAKQQIDSGSTPDPMVSLVLFLIEAKNISPSLSLSLFLLSSLSLISLPSLPPLSLSLPLFSLPLPPSPSCVPFSLISLSLSLSLSVSLSFSRSHLKRLECNVYNLSVNFYFILGFIRRKHYGILLITINNY